MKIEISTCFECPFAIDRQKCLLDDTLNPAKPQRCFNWSMQEDLPTDNVLLNCPLRIEQCIISLNVKNQTDNDKH